MFFIVLLHTTHISSGKFLNINKTCLFFWFSSLVSSSVSQGWSYSDILHSSPMGYLKANSSYSYIILSGIWLDLCSLGDLIFVVVLILHSAEIEHIVALLWYLICIVNEKTWFYIIFILWPTVCKISVMLCWNKNSKWRISKWTTLVSNVIVSVAPRVMSGVCRSVVSLVLPTMTVSIFLFLKCQPIFFYLDRFVLSSVTNKTFTWLG